MGTFVGETTHVASPSIAILDECDKGIDVRTTSPTSGDDGI